MLIEDKQIMLSDQMNKEGTEYNNAISLVVTYDCKEEVLKAFHVLKEGATILEPVQKTTYSSCFVSFIDKFGIRWEIMTEQTER